MKKIFNFTKKKKGSPSASDTGSVLSLGYDLKEKDLGKVHKAAFSGDVAKLKQLAKKNDLNQLDKENRTALHIACVHGHSDVVQFLVESKVKLNLCDNQNRSALMKAVQCHQDRCVAVLLEHEADPNLVDINGNTALHLAACIPSPSMAMKLLEHGANISAQNKQGNTPLILAVEENYSEMAEILLKEGADVNIKNKEQRLPLMIAACNGQICMVRLILKYNADITVKDDKGWSADDYAVMNGHHACSHLIIEHGAKRKSLQSPSNLASSNKKRASLLGSPETAFSLGGPALDKDAAGGSSKDTGKDIEDNSHTDSISRASKSGPADSWPSTDDDDDDDLELSPKKPQKVNLKKLMTASKRDQKEGHEEEQHSEVHCDSKLDAEGSDSLAEESEGENDEEEDDEEEEEEEEDDDDDDDEDDDDEADGTEDDSGEEDEEEEEESDEDKEDDEKSGQEVKTGIEMPIKAEITAVDGDDESAESNVQPDQSNALKEEHITANEPFYLMEKNAPQENAEFEGTETENWRQSLNNNVIQDTLSEFPPESSVPLTLDVEDDCLVSAIRVESRVSDEEEKSVFLNLNIDTTVACRTPLHSVDSNPGHIKTESSNKDADEEDWDDDDDDDDLLRDADSPVFEKQCVSLQSEGRDTLSEQLKGNCDEEHLTSDINADVSVLSKMKDKYEVDNGDGGDDDDVDADNTTKSSNLLITLLRPKDEPESSEDSWGSASDEEKAESVGNEILNIQSDNLKEDEMSKESFIEDDTVSKNQPSESKEEVSVFTKHISLLESGTRAKSQTKENQNEKNDLPVSLILGDNDQCDDAVQNPMNLSNKGKGSDQDSDSDIPRMQYDFVSCSVKCSGNYQNSDRTQDDDDGGGGVGDDSIIEENDHTFEIDDVQSESQQETNTGDSHMKSLGDIDETLSANPQSPTLVVQTNPKLSKSAKFLATLNIFRVPQSHQPSGTSCPSNNAKPVSPNSLTKPQLYNLSPNESPSRCLTPQLMTFTINSSTPSPQHSSCLDPEGPKHSFLLNDGFSRVPRKSSVSSPVHSVRSDVTQDPDQKSQTTVFDPYINTEHPNSNTISSDGADNPISLAEESETNLTVQCGEHQSCNEGIPQTDIDDVDVTSLSHENVEEDEQGSLKTQEHLDDPVSRNDISEQELLQQSNASSEDEYEEEEEEEAEDAEKQYDEEEDERSEGSELHEEVEPPQKPKGATQHYQRDFMSELGIEKEEEEEDSPWDSESASDSPRKNHGSSSPTKSHKAMSSICEESTEALRTGKDEENDDDKGEKAETQCKATNREPVSMLNKLMDSKDSQKKTDLIEELGLGDADDLEDASDWDSASTASKTSKTVPFYKLEEDLPGEAQVVLPVVQEQEIEHSGSDVQGSPSPEERKLSPIADPPLPSPRSITSHTSTQPVPQPQPRFRKNSAQTPESEESDWDTDNTSSPTKTTTPLSNIVETREGAPETQSEDGESGDNSESKEKTDQEKEVLGTSELDDSNPCHPAPSGSQSFDHDENDDQKLKEGLTETTWEHRYEKIWVESEKKATKSQYKNVAAELKERFGELEHKEASESSTDKQDDDDTEEVRKELKKFLELPESASDEDSSEEEGEPIVRPTARARSAKLLTIPEQRESGLEDLCSEEPAGKLCHSPSVKSSEADLPHNDLSKDQNTQQCYPEAVTGISAEPNNCDQGHTTSLSSENKKRLSSDFRTELQPEFGLNQDVSEECLTSPLLLISEMGIPSLKPKSPSLYREEEVKEGLQRFIIEGEVKKINVPRGTIKNTGDAVKQREIDQGEEKKTDTNPGKPKPQQEEKFDSGFRQKDDGIEKMDSVSPKWQTKKSINKRTADGDGNRKAIGSLGSFLHVPAPQQARPPCSAKQQNGDRLSVFDDSTLSEVSEDEGSSPSARHRSEKTGGDLEIADDFEDLTQSSDTATEELDSATSGYRHASLLIKQLDTSSIDSVSMVKLQNMFHEYERTIQKERDRHNRLADKVCQLEQERSELRHILEENREGKSCLERLRLELETDLNNLKFLLKQEQEKHQSVSMLYDKTREQLRRKEEQHCAEEEEKQKVELNMRNLELEMRALMNNMKQLEEDRNETQRLLAHERSARVLQEELLNSHRRKQKDVEEENLRNRNKSNEVMSQLTEASDRERELQHQVCTLQKELSSLRSDLECSQTHSRQEEGRLAEERDALRERLEDARRDLKLNEEALTQTVFQYNGQLSALKAEYSVVSTKLEHERQTRQQLEAETEANRTRLQAALQETEKCQVARLEVERTLQRERDEHRRVQEKLASDSGSQREAAHSMSQQLGKAEARANSLENECHRLTLDLAEKGVLLEAASREQNQYQTRLKEMERTLQSEREQAGRAIARQEAMQERLAQAQSEGALLRQQLEEAQNRGTAKEQAVTDAQERFADVLNQLRADGEERVQLVEERSRELVAKNAELREQTYKLEQEKEERESSLRQLQQELADALKKLSMCEASLEVNTRYRRDLEEEKSRTQKDMDRLREKLQDSEDQYLQAERRINSLKGSLDEKEREVISAGQKLQEALAASSSTEQTIKQLEEAMQRLEIENARLEAAAKQQANRVEVLQKEAREANVVRQRLEDLVTNLQSSKMTLEDQLSQEMQKQSMLSHNAQDSQALWEEELKSRSRIGLRLAELEKEKGELSNQIELEKKKARKTAEQKKAVDTRLDEEMKRNTELQKEMYRLRTLVKTAKKKLREQDGDMGSPLGSYRGELGNRYSETEGAIGRMKTKVDELQLQLEREAARCSRMEEVNAQLKDQLGSLKSLSRSHERLERSKRQLEEEVTGLRRQVEAGVMDHSKAEQYRRETEERARQEIRHKLEEVNLFLQTQAASQEALEQVRAANEASQRAQLEQRIRELEGELSHVRSTQQDSLVQRDSSRTELERYRQLYAEELRLRKSLTTKLERSNERLAEANAKLLSEKQRSKSFLTSSIMNGSLGGPALDTASLGSVGAYGASLGSLNRSLGLGTSLLGPVRETPSNHVEAYLAKMQSDLEKNISKQLDYVPAELESGSARMSPVGSASGSQKSVNLNVNMEHQDPLSRATQQYLEVLKKNYMI